MAYASRYYPDPRQSDSGYKLSFRDHLSHGYKYGQSWSTDPERRELERAYNEADRYQRHAYGYNPTPYSHASSMRHSGSHYASPHEEHEPVEGALVRHPTAAAHVDPHSGSNHSVSESVLAGYNDPPGPMHRSYHDSQAVTPEVIRTRSHDGGYSIDSRPPSVGPVYHSRSHGGYHWNHATGSSISSFRAHSRVPDSHSGYTSYGRYREPEDHYAESDEEDETDTDTDTDSRSASYHDPYQHRSHSHSHHPFPSEDAHHGHTLASYGAYEEPRYHHSGSREEDGHYCSGSNYHSQSYYPHGYHSSSTSTSPSHQGYETDRAPSPNGLDEYEHDLVTGVTYSDDGRTPDYELDEIYWDHAYDRDTSDGEYSRSDDYDDYDDGAYYSDDY